MFIKLISEQWTKYFSNTKAVQQKQSNKNAKHIISSKKIIKISYETKLLWNI